MAQEPPAPPGGAGGGAETVPGPDSTPEPTRSDLILFAQAVKGRWPMGPRVRLETLKHVAAILADEHARPRNILAAARILIEADRVNLQAEALEFAMLGNRDDMPTAHEILSQAEQAALDFDRDENASDGAPPLEPIGPAPV